MSWILAEYLPSASQPKSLFTKIGLYTSPHLRFVRERIQINNEPLTEEIFARYFFEVWNRLEDAAHKQGKPTDRTAKPVYFRYLTLMAFHAFMSEGVDTAVIECGIGGEYDSTNVIANPTACGITSLGIDHTALLGDTIEEIAWHKAGIMKTGVPCFTVPQPPSASSVLQQRADSKTISLTIVPTHPAISAIKIGLAAPFQLRNASLAIALAASHLTTLDHADRVGSDSDLSSEFVRGLQATRWPGRCEVRQQRNILWHIDSGHTLDSIKAAASWFASRIPPAQAGNISGKPTRILLFNQQTRDANALARALYDTLATALHDDRPFTHVVFCTNVTFRESGYRPDLQSINADATAVQSLAVQKGLAETWKGLDPTSHVNVVSSIEEAVSWCNSVADELKEEIMVLVTGSVHLVGGFLEVLESTPSTNHDTSTTDLQK